MKSMKDIKLLKSLISDIEWKIGGECYNSNIQNYGSWGAWEGEGREFKYPINYFNSKKEKIKKRYISTDMTP